MSSIFIDSLDLIFMDVFGEKPNKLCQAMEEAFISVSE